MLIPISNKARASHCQYEKKEWEKGQQQLKSELLHMTEEFAKGTTSFNNNSYAHIYVEKSKRPISSDNF